MHTQAAAQVSKCGTLGESEVWEWIAHAKEPSLDQQLFIEW